MEQVETHLKQLEKRLTRARRRALVAWTLGAGVLAAAVIHALLPPASAQGVPGIQERVNQLEVRVNTLEGQVAAQGLQISALESLLLHVSRDGDDLFVTGANLHIVNGAGTTESTNGLGNLIVGYNEARETTPDVRTGSHNVVVGGRHDFSSFGGLVVGDLNTISGRYASVSGGVANIAGGIYTSVSGGFANRADGFSASISGGINNYASGQYASVSGGENNVASGGRGSWAGGGNGNRAAGNWSSVSGGLNNSASAGGSSVSGGADVTELTPSGWAAGSESGTLVSGNFRSP